MDQADIKKLLTDWGMWTKIGGIDVGYPHTTTFYRLSKMGGWGARHPLIDDEMARRVDRAVASLELRCRNLPEDYRYRALEWVYLKCQPQYRLGEKYRLDRRTVSTALQAAESWVDSQIFTDELMLAIVPHEVV